MKCRTFLSMLKDYIAGELPQGKDELMAEHINKCEKCKEIYEEQLKTYKSVLNICQTENAGFISSRDDIIERIDKSRYSRSFTKKFGFFFRRNSLRLAAGTAGIAAVIVFAFLTINYFRYYQHISAPDVKAPVNKSIKTDKIVYKNEKLGFSLSFPSSWKDKYTIVENDNGVRIYFKPSESVPEYSGYLFAVLKRANLGMPEDSFDTVGSPRTFVAKGIEYIVGGPTDVTFPSDNKEYADFCKLRSQIDQVVSTIKADKVEGNSVQTDNSITKKQYEDFILQRDTNKADTVLFYADEDIEQDGRNEVVIASGQSNSEATAVIINYLFVLRNNNGKIEQLGDNLAAGGYYPYEIKLIRLQDMPGEYIYCHLTNGVSLRGFKIYKIADNKPVSLCYSASATGNGDDEITDSDSDGQIDGYKQCRYSYDVLYYNMTRTYKWKNKKFTLVNTDTKIPAYPENIKDTVVQYLSLRVLDDGTSQGITRRLSELCVYNKAKDIEIEKDVWLQALYELQMDLSSKVNVSVNENGNAASADISYKDDKNNTYQYKFHLIKTEDKWQIDNISK